VGYAVNCDGGLDTGAKVGIAVAPGGRAVGVDAGGVSDGGTTSTGGLSPPDSNHVKEGCKITTSTNNGHVNIPGTYRRRCFQQDPVNGLEIGLQKEGQPEVKQTLL
jgi:hypothetical protein